MVTFLKHQMKEGRWKETDFVAIVWDSVMQAVDWGSRPEQIETQALRQVKVRQILYL